MTLGVRATLQVTIIYDEKTLSVLSSFLRHKGRRNHEIKVYIVAFLLFPSFLSSAQRTHKPRSQRVYWCFLSFPFLPSFCTKDSQTTKSTCILVLSFLPVPSFLLHKGRRNHEIKAYTGTFPLFPPFLSSAQRTPKPRSQRIYWCFLPSFNTKDAKSAKLMRNRTHNNPSVTEIQTLSVTQLTWTTITTITCTAFTSQAPV